MPFKSARQRKWCFASGTCKGKKGKPEFSVSSLSEDEQKMFQKTVYKWTTSFTGCKKIRDDFRDGTSENDMDYTRTLRKIFKEYDGNYHGTIYRGLNTKTFPSLKERFKDIKVGDVIDMKAPTSWTSRFRTAKNFAHDMFLMIRRPKKVAYDISEYSRMNSEKEKIVRPTKLRVRRIIDAMPYKRGIEHPYLRAKIIEVEEI